MAAASGACQGVAMAACWWAPPTSLAEAASRLGCTPPFQHTRLARAGTPLRQRECRAGTRTTSHASAHGGLLYGQGVLGRGAFMLFGRIQTPWMAAPRHAGSGVRACSVLQCCMRPSEERVAAVSVEEVRHGWQEALDHHAHPGALLVGVHCRQGHGVPDPDIMQPGAGRGPDFDAMFG